MNTDNDNAASLGGAPFDPLLGLPPVSTDDFLHEALLAASRIKAETYPEHDASTLADAFLALHERLCNGDRLPTDWQPAAVAARRRAALVADLRQLRGDV